MERPWFAGEPVDESFLAGAPVRMRARFEVPRPAAEVWSELTGEWPLHWCRILQEVRWNSPPPLGAGSTRFVKALWGANNLRERYFRWEEGRQHSFYVVESTAPLARRFAEDYLVEPTGAGSCRFTWVIAFDPQPLARPGRPLTKRLRRTLFSATRDYFGLG
jgi:hypothetical protein